MIDSKIQKELDNLVNIAREQDYKINSVTFYNIYTALPSSEKTNGILSEMEDYINERNVSIITDGVEIDETDDSISVEEKIRPFDPSKIDIAMQPLSMSALIKRIENEEVNLNTEFQRKGGLWSQKQKSQLIESLFLKIPLPAFYFDAEKEDYWLIIDGLQRITTLKEFIVDKTLSLSGLEFFTDLNGLNYSQLPRTFTRRVDETDLVAYIVKKGTPTNVKYNIFKRINTGGLELTPQEIRHALYQGQATKVLKILSQSENFKQATGYSIRTDRMMDQEFVLRFIAVCFVGIDKYEGYPDDYLNNAMGFLNQINNNVIDQIKNKFDFIMNIAYKIFGKYAFRKMGSDGWRRPINKAIFEVWCKILSELSNDSINVLIDNSQFIQSEFIQLCESDSFITCLKASDKKYYQLRFVLTRKIIGGIIDDNKC